MTQTDSVQPNKGKGCLLAVIGCGALSIIGLLLFIIIILLVGDDKKSATSSSSSQTQQTTSLNTASTTSQPVNNAKPSVPSFTDALRIIYPEGPYQPIFPLMPNESPKGTCSWQNGVLHRHVPILDGSVNANTPANKRFHIFTTVVSDMVSFQQDGKSKLLVVMGSTSDDNVFDQPLLGAALLYWNGTSWALENRSDELNFIASDGAGVPKGELVKIGPDRFGYMIRASWLNQGIMGGVARIIGQNPEGVIQDFAEIHTSSNNEGAGLAANATYSYDSKIEFLKNQKLMPSSEDDTQPREGYYPLRITRKGTCAGVAGGIDTVDHSVIYQMYEEGYATIDDDPLIEICSPD